jgi:hypothetical protein
MSLLVKPPADLTDFSLLVLCDLASSRTGSRKHDRYASLLTGYGSVHAHGVPAPINALEDAQLVEVRRSYDRSVSPPRIKFWIITITDRGLALHRHLMRTLKTTTSPQS